MLFNSYEFLLLYLPLVLCAYFWAGGRSRLGAAWLLGIASMLFYAWWDWRFTPLLLGSIVFNFFAGRALGSSPHRGLLAAAIAANLALLGVFKYLGLFASGLNQLQGVSLTVPQIVLPLGISFFTFTQIAFLVDAYRGIAHEYRFSHYLLFVSYFPHLIAGPLLHHRQMMPQFAQRETYRPQWDNLAIGATTFVIGLAKKVLIADGLAPHADAAFDAVSEGRTLLLLEAWIGVLAYTFQLYFDFSGYSDMAVGLARMFNVRLPVNFDSPYKATSLAEFWRRWHMTLYAFLREYVYLPLGGNRKSRALRLAAVFGTMLLSGLWHGAAWTFVLWGGLHGVLLVVNFAWRAMCRAYRISYGPAWLRAGAGWTLTFLAWTFTLLLFRSQSWGAAWDFARAMLGANGVSLPAMLGSWEWGRQLIGAVLPQVSFTGTVQHLGFGLRGFGLLLIAAAVVFFMPNSQQLIAVGESEKSRAGERIWHLPLQWRPGPAWAGAMAVLLALVVLNLSRPSPFLYFQF
jgi:alginate O-acetyltransferase complex protein AlgI